MPAAGGPPTLSGLDLDGLVAEAAADHGVVGAAVAVLSDGHITEAATGVANRDTAVPVTTDTLFQIGSVTKLYTATLVMQLVDAGTIDLDTPVRRYLPEVRFGDPVAGATVTVRQLLSHTAGLEGDHFADFGRGDDAIERYVASLADLPQLHPPGAMMSYCNSGWVLLGYLVERLAAQPFHRALATRLLEPAGLADTLTLPEEAILRRVAVGHIPDREAPDELVVSPVWSVSPASAPAGSLTCATAADVVRFARLHLHEGRSRDGTRVLSARAAAAMREPQVELVDRVSFGDAWGLGWILMTWDGEQVVGHDGGSVGQSSSLRVHPGRGLALAILTNGGPRTSRFMRAVTTEVFGSLAGVTPPPRPTPLPDPDLDLDRYTGRFARHHLTLHTRASEGTLVADVTNRGALADLFAPITDVALTPVGDDTFLGTFRGVERPVVFFAPEQDGRFGWVHLHARAHRREA